MIQLPTPAHSYHRLLPPVLFFQLAQLLHVAGIKTCVSCPPPLERLIRDATLTTRALTIAQMQHRPSFVTYRKYSTENPLKAKPTSKNSRCLARDRDN